MCIVYVACGQTTHAELEGGDTRLENLIKNQIYLINQVAFVMEEKAFKKNLKSLFRRQIVFSIQCIFQVPAFSFRQLCLAKRTAKCCLASKK